MSIRRIQLRRDTTSNWEGINPALRQGECGVEVSTGKSRLKIGDGFTSWNDLPYIEQEGIDALKSEYGNFNTFDIQFELNK